MCRQVKVICLFLTFATLLLATSGAWAQPTSAEPAPLVFWNRQITVFRSYYEQTSPAERARNAEARLAALPESSEWTVVSNQTTRGQYTGAVITANGHFAFGILTTDLDAESQETLDSAAALATAQLQAALQARSQQRNVRSLIKSIGLSLGATLLLIVAIVLLNRARRIAIARVDLKAAPNSQRLKVAGLDLRPVIHAINRRLVSLTMWAAILVLLYLWLTFVLLRFPYSQPWGQQLRAYLINLFAMLGNGLLRSIPGFFTVVVIFLLARLITRAIAAFFTGVEKGTIQVSWLHADTVRATRYLLIVLIWIFALVVAFPFIPGSSSDAFKGISVLLGLMVSLGSAGLINHVMSGLVVVYSRALRPGEFVRVGDYVGVVSEVGMLSTKILTRKREEITFPNAVLVGKTTVNYSRHAGDAGAVVGTTLTIGYDAPWRLVHEMLLRAADQTAGVRRDPAPRVWQKALSDFYVEYELLVNLDRPEDRVPVLSELHKNIQDAFNEHGVQIMSPHYEMQPKDPVVVPKAQWFPKSAEATTGNDGAKARD